MKQILSVGLLITCFSVLTMISGVNTHKIDEFRRLQEAAETGNAQAVKRVVDSGININVKLLGGTVLHKEAYRGDLAAVKALIENGAQVDSRNLQTVSKPPRAEDRGRTPLHIAAAGHKFDVVKYLVEHGANITATDSNDNTPLDLAKKNKKKLRRSETITYLEDKIAGRT